MASLRRLGKCSSLWSCSRLACASVALNIRAGSPARQRLQRAGPVAKIDVGLVMHLYADARARIAHELYAGW